MTYTEISLALENAETALAEVTSQYGSEVSLYGDAWPGAIDNIEQARQVVAKIRAERDAHPDHVDPLTVDADDIDY